MSDPTSPSQPDASPADAAARPVEPGDRPPDPRRLDRAPGDRYATGPAARRRSRGVPPLVAAFVATDIGAVLLVVVGEVLALTTGLILVSGAAGAVVGLLAAGATQEQRSERPLTRRTAVRIAVVLAIGMVVAAAAVAWFLARAGGGVLGPLDYLWTVYGPLPALEAGVAAVAAAWGATAGPVRARD